jgi:hypothetical protein
MKSTKEAKDVLRSLFNGIDRKKLPSLMQQGDVSIALHAAWHFFVNPGDPSYKARPQRFLGFLQGRTGLAPPLEWEALLVYRSFQSKPMEWEQAALKEYLSTYPGSELVDGMFCFPAKQRHKTQSGFEADKGTRIEKTGDKFVIQWEKKTLRIDATLLKAPTDRSTRACTVLIGSKRSWVAVSSSAYGEPFDLMCVELQSGRLLWKSQVLGSGVWGLGTGQPSHDCKFVENGKLIAVFGSSCADGYTEAFDIETGRPAFRFFVDDGRYFR